MTMLTPSSTRSTASAALLLDAVQPAAAEPGTRTDARDEGAAAFDRQLAERWSGGPPTVRTGAARVVPPPPRTGPRPRPSASSPTAHPAVPIPTDRATTAQQCAPTTSCWSCSWPDGHR